MKKLVASTIHNATVVQALLDLEAAGIYGATTAQVGEVLLRPVNYDIGSKLFALTQNKNNFLEKRVNPDNLQSVNKLFYVTEKGRKYHGDNLDKVQRYGEYKLVGKDKAVTKKVSGTALQALAELQAVVDKNSEVKAFLESIYNQLDGFLQELEEEN